MATLAPSCAEWPGPAQPRPRIAGVSILFPLAFQHSTRTTPVRVDYARISRFHGPTEFPRQRSWPFRAKSGRSALMQGWGVRNGEGLENTAFFAIVVIGSPLRCAGKPPPNLARIAIAVALIPRDFLDLLPLLPSIERISSISVTMSPPWSFGRKVLMLIRAASRRAPCAQTKESGSFAANGQMWPASRRAFDELVGSLWRLWLPTLVLQPLHLTSAYTSAA